MHLLTSDEPVDLEIAREKPAKAMAMLEATDPKIRSLRLWFCGLKSMEILARFSDLRLLVMSDWLASDLNVLESLPKLEQLGVLHLPKITDLGPLSALPQLQALALETLPSWDASGKVQKVKSLAPIGDLKKLKALRLYGVVPNDGRLDVLAGAAALKEFECGDHYSLESMAALAVMKPGLDLQPCVKLDHIKCKKCNEPRVMLQGRVGTRRPRWACSVCEQDRIEAHEAEFEALKAAVKQK